MKKIVLGSHNPGKLKDFENLGEVLGFEIVSVGEFTKEEAIEDGLSYVENAIIKARHASRAAGGLPAIADDSGLSVDVLDGAPGIYSARYAGDHGNDEANIDKLLEVLSGENLNASAKQICCLVFVRHPNDPLPIIVVGVQSGTISTKRTGNGGFGYDKVFYNTAARKHASEFSDEERKIHSHRFQAINLLRMMLNSGNDIS